MKILDNNKKLLGKINIFDLLFVLVVLILLFAIWFRYFHSNKKEVFLNNNDILYTVKFEKVNIDFINNIKKGDKFYYVSNQDNVYVEIGVIDNIEKEEYKYLETNVDGTVNYVENKDYYNVLLTISCKGKVTDQAYYANSNYKLYVNKKFEAVTKYNYFEEASILSIKESKNEGN